MSSNGFLQLYSNNSSSLTDSKNIPVDKYIFDMLVDQFHQQAFEEINSPKSKLHSYSKLKTKIGIEKYLTQISNINHRIAMTKIRLSNHKLSIETGRHQKIDRLKRICPFCPRYIENEEHFMIKCPIYNETRDRLLPQSIIKNCYSSDEIKLTQILGNSNSCNVILIAQYISESMSLRENKIKTDSLKLPFANRNYHWSQTIT